MSFKELLTNSPSDKREFFIKKKPRKQEVWLGTESTKVIIEHPHYHIHKLWGYCDGNQAFIYHEKDFFPLKFKNDTFSFFGYGLTNDVDIGSGMAMATGGLAVGSMAYLNSRIEVKNQIVHFYLNPFTGVTTKYPKAKIDTGWPPPTASVIIYRGKSKERDTTLYINLNGEYELEFVPGTAYQMSVLQGETLNICAKGQSETCATVTNHGIEYRYIRISLSMKANVVEIGEMDYAKGNWESNLAREAQRKRIE